MDGARAGRVQQALHDAQRVVVSLDLEGGGSCVIGPVRGMDPEDLEVRALVAPNHFHHLGLAEWSTRFPGASVCALDRTKPRLERVTGRTLQPLRGLELARGARFLEPDGTASGEVWVEIDRTWIVCDAFFNEPVTPSGLMGFVLWATGTTPGLRIGSTFLWLGLAERRAYKEWLTHALEERRPVRIVPAHGEIVSAPDLADRLLDLARARL